MHLTQKEVFWKCWLWAIISSVVVAGIFWWFTDVAGLFRGKYGGTVFLDLMLALCIFTSDFGAGFVGWRIADKYYPQQALAFRRRYIWYCVAAFVLLMAIIFSPFSFLGMFWSFLAPACVIWAFGRAGIKLPKSYAAITRTRNRRR